MSLSLIYAMAFVLSVAVTSYMIPKIIVISFKKKLFDTVDGRKVHTGNVPRLGGVAFMPTIIITFSLIAGVHIVMGQPIGPFLTSCAPIVGLYLCSLIFLYLEGIADDLVGVGYKPKFAVMFFAALLIACSGTYIHDFHGLLFLHRLPAWVGGLLSMFLIVFVINAINLIDGVDGLASGVSMLAFFFFFVLFARVGDGFFAMLSLVSLGMLIPFWIYNVFGKVERKKKIFMGDTGAQTVGLLLSVLAIRLSMYPAGSSDLISHPLGISMTLLLVPCFDLLRVFVWRIRHRRNPFLPDRQHIHHKLLAIGMSPRTTMTTVISIAAFYILLNFSLFTVLNINLILLVDIAIYAFLHIALSHIIRKKAVMFTASEEKSGGPTPEGHVEAQ